jgi:hypothetical protein
LRERERVSDPICQEKQCLRRDPAENPSRERRPAGGRERERLSGEKIKEREEERERGRWR